MLKWNNNVGKKNDNEPTDRLTVGLIAKKNSWHRRIPIFGLLELPYKLLILLVVALLLSSSFAVFYYTNWKRQNKVIIHIGDYKIKKPEYNKLISQAKQLKISEDDADKQIREALASRAAADKVGVNYDISDDFVLQAVQSSQYNVARKDLTDYNRLSAYPKLINASVELKENGGYRFSILDFPFSRYIVGFFREDFGDIKLIGNESAVRDDIAYAEQQKARYADSLKNGRQSIGETVEEILNDKRLVNGQFGNQSSFMMINNSGIDLLNSTPLGVGDLLGEVKQASGKLNQPLTSDQLFTASPDEYSLTSIPELNKDGKTRVGWRVITVNYQSDGEHGVRGKFNKVKQEYQTNVRPK